MRRPARSSPLRRVPGLVPLARWLADRIDPDRRELARLHRLDGVFQPFPTTREDRYPLLFDLLAERLSQLERPEILSFGCASGEEVRALRRRLPHARITGLDPNRRAIAAARRTDANPLSQYCQGDRPDPAARYDAVLALAVFRHGSLRCKHPPASCAGVLGFSAVEEGLKRLDRVLRPGGWLAIGNNHFRFADMPLAQRFGDLVPADLNPIPDPLYGPDERLLEVSQRRLELYRKLAAGSN